MSKTLHLTLKKQWFDMIASGEKTEEYRELKDYWDRRLGDVVEWRMEGYIIPDYSDDFGNGLVFKNFDFIHFYNGGSPSLKYRNFIIECLGISIGKGRPEWGAPEQDVFIIKLGKILTP